MQPNEHRADEYRMHAEQLRARADQLSLYPATRDLLLSLIAQCHELAKDVEAQPKDRPGSR